MIWKCNAYADGEQHRPVGGRPKAGRKGERNGCHESDQRGSSWEVGRKNPHE